MDGRIWVMVVNVEHCPHPIKMDASGQLDRVSSQRLPKHLSRTPIRIISISIRTFYKQSRTNASADRVPLLSHTNVTNIEIQCMRPPA